jgi:4-amino-4-deoxy-L-arabinose transferase-like glycosyltransferase
VRLLKPPLVYYQVVAGFALFGQSVFAVKSMWILNALLVLGLTWALARRWERAGRGRLPRSRRSHRTSSSSRAR